MDNVKQVYQSTTADRYVQHLVMLEKKIVKTDDGFLSKQRKL